MATCFSDYEISKKQVLIVSLVLNFISNWQGGGSDSGLFYGSFS